MAKEDGPKKGGKKPAHGGHKFKNRRSYKEDQEVQQLEKVLKEGAPLRGSNPLAAEPADGSSASYAGARTFDELPISQYTRDGLRKAKYVTLTAIQRAALPHALCGRDILGAAKTGSGKTLSFLIPVVEKLYRSKWTRLDGLGGLVLTPTRELAVQIFEELKKVGQYHELSAALLIGGKAVADEQLRVNRMNILVCTPGRLLQHMDETPGFDASQLQILVLDEADRILDMGFAATVDAIVANLPRERQTMLFSATQTKSVRDLARLSLVDPEYLAVHAEAATPTPLKLQQAYMVVELGQKMDVLWSFIKTHLKAKTIIFLSTCKQVRFVFEAFRKLRPGVPLRCLHGGMKQPKRTGVFYEFCNSQDMVLIATDIAARGLDFPTVDWVVQADCPEDAATYIHRVGRTARYMAAGRALLLLLPSERDAMLAALEAAKVPLKQIKPNPAKQQAVVPALQALLSKDQELKDFAQKALTAYLRSVFLQPQKAVFNVAALPVEDYAASLGLASVPKLRFLKRVRGKQQVVEIGGKGALDADEEEEEPEETEEGAEEGPAAKRARREAGEGGSVEEAEERAAVERRAAGAAAGVSGAAGKKRPGAAAGAGTKKEKEQEDDDDDLFVVKKRNVFEDGEELPVPAVEPVEDDGRKKKKKRQKIKVGTASGNRMVFDEQGNALDPLEQLASEQLGAKRRKVAASGAEGGEDEEEEDEEGDEGLHVVGERAEDRFRRMAQLMRGRDKEDRARLKQLKKEIKLEKKDRARAAAAAEAGEEVQVTLPSRGRAAHEDEGSSEEEDHHDDEGGEEGGAGGRRSRNFSSDGSSGGGSEEGSEGSEDEEEEERGRGGKMQRSKRAPEVAHMGMRRLTATDGAGAAGVGAAGKAKGGAAGMSLAEQEALALQLLGSRR